MYYNVSEFVEIAGKRTSFYPVRGRLFPTPYRLNTASVHRGQTCRVAPLALPPFLLPSFPPTYLPSTFRIAFVQTQVMANTGAQTKEGNSLSSSRTSSTSGPERYESHTLVR